MVDIQGRERVTGVTLARVDENRRPIPGTEEHYDCDTLLLSCGLIPENELSRGAGVEISPVTNGPVVDESLETSVPGVFACGNVLHVHDLVDFVSQEAEQAGRRAARFLRKGEERGRAIQLVAGKGVRYTVPARVDPCRMEEELTVRFRVDNVYRGTAVTVSADGKTLQRRKKLILTPGEMEEIRLRREELLEHPEWEEIEISLEVAP